MLRLLSIGVLSGSLSSGCCCNRSAACESRNQQQLDEDAAMQQVVSKNVYHIKSSYSSEKEGFYIVYDTKTRNPAYVVEKLSRFDTMDATSDLKKASKRPPFSPEYLITDDQFRVSSCCANGVMTKPLNCELLADIRFTRKITMIQTMTEDTWYRQPIS
jgi:hypothetical protein